ncbi:hypothetical protein GCM10023091_09730 [Ravibacter arvi]|uniref:Uncharacterized protein n=1 Tax=Ravibacter arvi TaxID=2051041 RepID=A0ABP8LU83_9BACT
MHSEKNRAVFFLVVFLVMAGISVRVLHDLVPESRQALTRDLSAFPVPRVMEPDTSLHRLSVVCYRQIGNEIHLLPYAESPGLAPFEVTIEQDGFHKNIAQISSLYGSWLRIPAEGLKDGPFSISLRSKPDSTCRLRLALRFDRPAGEEIADSSQWFRQGSDDDLLDVRVCLKNGKYYLKDFANYNDGRTRTYFLEGMITDSLESGIEVRPGYLYTVVARWIDGPYSQWWNAAHERASRQQTIWIDGHDATPTPPGHQLTRINMPGWFIPSRRLNPHFDKLFPKFKAPEGKLVMMYRLNHDTSPAAYFDRGVTHLPRWESGIDPEKQHWTEAPGFFEDRGEEWFGSLSRQEVEAYADRVGKIGVYAYDFEFWHRNYKPAIKERLLWFSKRLKETHPDLYLFDYWGGSAYHNTTFQDKDGYFAPQNSLPDYTAPRSNHYNFIKNKDGDFFGRYFNVTPVDVYPRPPLLTGNGNFTLNNYLVLSAIHASRINRLFDFQKDNKTIWFAWNRFMPLYQDPPFPTSVTTTSPEGTLVFNGLETLPPSQALALSLFALTEGDGFYLWSDSQPWGQGANQYAIDNTQPYQAPALWQAADGKATTALLDFHPELPEAPRYWDYPSDFFALGNWMAGQTGDILKDGHRQDLSFFYNGKWHTPQKEQAVLAARNHLPFVTAVKKGEAFVVLALHSFQAANQTTRLKIRLPDQTETSIELYGNWPSLYKGASR